LGSYFRYLVWPGIVIGLSVAVYKAAVTFEPDDLTALIVAAVALVLIVALMAINNRRTIGRFIP
jgi:hypothetical protein